MLVLIFLKIVSNKISDKWINIDIYIVKGIVIVLMGVFFIILLFYYGWDIRF